MNTIRLYCICLVFMLGCSPTSDNAPAPDLPVVQRQVLAEWTERDELPCLRADLISPIKNADTFEVSGFGVEFPKGGVKPRTVKAVTFETDEQAIGAALDWLKVHFGELPDGVKLKATAGRVEPTISPNPYPEWESDYDVTFRSSYRGIPTDRSTRLLFRGTIVFSANVALFRFTPHEKPRTIVSAIEAKDAWRKILIAQNLGKDELKQFEREIEPKLLFYYSPQPNIDVKFRFQVLSPNWALSEAEQCLVDGHSGKAWFDD